MDGKLCFFFFSSRRRHTRSTRDWSSDVCSSDLVPWPMVLSAIATLALVGIATTFLAEEPRSEERRVGKECRSRWSPDHSKKKRTKARRQKRRRPLTAKVTVRDTASAAN